MQQKDEKTAFFAHQLGNLIREIRVTDRNCSINKFAREYDLDIGNTSRVEAGKTDVKFVTLWKISEALEIKPSKLVEILEKRLGNNFHFFDD